jgi:catechol 2,3-dioxygenase-like lactoylglutathione lyase family enzyme
MRIGITEIFVDDQARARTFYAQVLGLRVKTDVPYSETAHWLTMVSPEDPDGTELLLSPATEPATALQESRRAAGSPAISFLTDNCQHTYDELRAKGVEFVSEPRQMDYGGTDAVFEDGCGNLLNLHQD